MAEANDPTELVSIRPKGEPDTAPARVTREAFDTIYAGRDFVIVDADNKELGAKAAAKSGGDAK